MQQKNRILYLLGGLLVMAMAARAVIQRTNVPEQEVTTTAATDTTRSAAFAERPLTLPSSPLTAAIEDQPTTTLDLKGKIGRSPITLHLAYVETFSENSTLYTVQGWYQYDKYQQRIPLVGYRDLGELILYVTDDPASRQVILDTDLLPHRKADYTIVMQERLKIDLYQKSGTWEGNGKSLTLTLAADDDIEVLKHHYALLLKTADGETWASLPQDIWSPLARSYELELVGQQITAAPVVVLLQFAHMGNSNVQGRCGAAEDIGFMRLEVTQDTILQEATHYVSECYQGRYMELDEAASSPMRRVYTGSQSGYEDGEYVEKQLTIVVDLKALTITEQ